MSVNSVVIYGDVKGQINAEERVEICSGSVVDGDVKTARACYLLIFDKTIQPHWQSLSTRLKPNFPIQF